jgi:nucleotide-binding universal stress UspA family protein
MLPPKLILAPIDFSDPSHQAMNVAVDLAARFGAELLLVHVVPAIPNLLADVSILKERAYDENLTAEAAQRLTDLAASLAPKNIKVRTEIGTANDVDMEIVVKQSSCPVLVLRANPTAHAGSDGRSASVASS